MGKVLVPQQMQFRPKFSYQAWGDYARVNELGRNRKPTYHDTGRADAKLRRFD